MYVQPVPPTGVKWQVSTNGGVNVRWRRDGKELFYLAYDDDKLMAVEVNASADFKAGLPKALFQTRGLSGSPSRYAYAVSADGQRFLLNMAVEEAASSPINVVVNWSTDLKS